MPSGAETVAEPAQTADSHVETVTGAVKDMAIEGDDGAKLNDQAVDKLSRRLRDLEKLVRQQAGQLQDLRTKVAKQRQSSDDEDDEDDEEDDDDEDDDEEEEGEDGDSDDEDAESNTNASDAPPAPVQRSTTEMKFARWAAVRRTLKEALHPAFYILVGTHNEHDSPVANSRPDDRRNEVEEISQKLPEGRFEQPEFIMFKSRHLMLWLRWNIDDSNLGYDPEDEHMHYMIERPFKLLVYGAGKIRNGLAEFEDYRRKTNPTLTEEDFEKEWEENPPIDNAADVEVDAANLTLPQLTGLIKDIRTLVKFMDHFIVPLETRESYEHVYFSELWYAFPLGSLIYVKDRNVPQKVWKVLQRLGASPFPMILPDGSRSRSRFCPFVIDCYYIDFDGNRYFPVYRRIFIEPFQGLEKSTDLIACPLEVAKAAGLIDTDSLVARGRDFIEHTRPTHRDYTGRNQLEEPNGTLLVDSELLQGRDDVSLYSEWIDSEAMIDIERAFHAVRGWRPVDSEPPQVPERDYDDIPAGWTCHFDRYWDIRVARRLMSTETDKWGKWDRDHPPTDPDDLLLLPGRVFGFVFQTRRWTSLRLGKSADGQDMIRVRQCRPEPWNDLQLPDGHKSLVQSLIESHIMGNLNRKLQFDLVRAKGRGVVMLLHGVPGVGKTSTAECAAEAYNKPLLPITCGDLGTSPKEVEAKLQETFQLAQVWDCILLLDEADVFLAQRTADDIQRNALVSVFLRTLEYYEGVLFLTSNRVGVFDEALKSRLHLSLYYPPLSWKYTRRIWESHLDKLSSSGLIDLDAGDIVDYAETLFEAQERKGSTIGPVWNGRQIRNAFQSAVALAGYRHRGEHKIVLTRDHFEKVSRVSDQFNNYLWSIQSKTDAERASAWGIRHDHWSRPGEGFNAAPGRRPRADSIDGGLLSFGRATTPYQGQMMPSSMQSFPPQQGVSMGAQPIFQGQYQHGQTQFGQPQMMTQTSTGTSFEQQPGFTQQPQQRLEQLPSYTQQRQQQMQAQDPSRSGAYIG